MDSSGCLEKHHNAGGRGLQAYWREGIWKGKERRRKSMELGSGEGTGAIPGRQDSSTDLIGSTGSGSIY